MKTYLYRLLLLLLPLIILFSILSFIADEGLKKTDYITYKQWSRLSEVKNLNADLLILGNSRASCHVDPVILDSLLPVHSYNLGLLGGSLLMQMHAYHLYKKDNTELPRIILMNVDEWSFDNKDKLNTKKSNFIPWTNDPDWQAICDESGFTWAEKSIPFVKYIGAGKLFIDGLFEYCGFAKLDYGGFVSTYNRGYMVLNGSFSAGKIPTSWDTVTCDLSTLESFLSVCRDERIQVVFFYSPLYKEYRERNEEYDKKLPYLVHLAATWNIPFLDYSQTPECNDSTYFRDFAHLSRKGAVWLTENLANDIDSLVNISKPSSSVPVHSNE